MILPKKPNDGRNIPHALVIACNNDGNIVRNATMNTNIVGCSQNVQTSNNKQIKPVDTIFMGLIPENTQANTLNGIKKQQEESEKDIKYHRKRIAQYFGNGFHSISKVKNRSLISRKRFWYYLFRWPTSNIRRMPLSDFRKWLLLDVPRYGGVPTYAPIRHP